ILALVALGAIFFALDRPALRIRSVEVRGADTLLPGPAPADLAEGVLAGAYFRLVPKDSAFFYPAQKIRAAIIAAHPEIAAISFGRDGLRTLVVKVSMHTAVGRWCGLAPTAGVAPYCYFFDPSGFIYAAVPEQDASTTAPSSSLVNSFPLYAPLADNAQEPMAATIARATQLPDALAFARQMASFGSPVSAVVVRSDPSSPGSGGGAEVDLLLASGTRVTYVLGHEEDAFSALTSAKPDLDLASGSLDYVDLRFPGKVYFKKKGE
ncbi:MAG: hypothetical protein KGH97_03530, partial [Patescibacteria group bacterium]|nr:hypothetical protein [Patescibacteria group bacterium]